MKKILYLTILFYIILPAYTSHSFWFDGFGKKKEAYSFNKRAVELANQKKWTEALSNIEKAYNLSPDEKAIEKNYVSILNGLALEYADGNNWIPALEYLNKAHEVSPDDVNISNNLATLHNNYAIELVNEDKLDEAKDHFLQARSFNKTNLNFSQGLANLLIKMGQQKKSTFPDKAKSLFRESIGYDPSAAIAYAEIGELEWSDQNYKEALENYENAVKYLPSLKQKLNERMEKCKTLSSVEKDYRQYDRGIFRIRFKGYEREDIAWQLLNQLEFTYGRLAPIFGYLHENQTITVTIYTSDDFKKVTLSPDWTGGIYDGQIRLKIGDIEYGGDALARLISHEFAHALIHQLTSGNIPVWLNEGLAQYVEPDNKISANEKERIKTALNGNSLPTFSSLSKPFVEINDAETVRLYYALSKTFVYFIVSRYGEYSLRRLLDSLGTNKNLDDALFEVFYLKLPEMEINWKFYLEEILK